MKLYLFIFIFINSPMKILKKVSFINFYWNYHFLVDIDVMFKLYILVSGSGLIVHNMYNIMYV